MSFQPRSSRLVAASVGIDPSCGRIAGLAPPLRASSDWLSEAKPDSVMVRAPTYWATLRPNPPTGRFMPSTCDCELDAANTVRRKFFSRRSEIYFQREVISAALELLASDRTSGVRGTGVAVR